MTGTHTIEAKHFILQPVHFDSNVNLQNNNNKLYWFSLIGFGERVYEQNEFNFFHDYSTETLLVTTHILKFIINYVKN